MMKTEKHTQASYFSQTMLEAITYPDSQDFITQIFSYFLRTGYDIIIIIWIKKNLQ